MLSLLTGDLVSETRGFSFTNERANLWTHNLVPLNAPIQSEASIGVSESDFKNASDWIGTFKGPNVGGQRLSGVRFRLALVLSEKSSGLHGTDGVEKNI